MTLEDALAALKDIEGLDIGWMDIWLDMLRYWGSWTVLAVLMLWVVHRMMKRRAGGQRNQRRKMRRAALAQLRQIRGEAMAEHARLERINHLLKQCAAHLGYRQEVAGLTGSAWLNWLARKAGQVHPPKGAWLEELLYAPPDAEQSIPPEFYPLAEQALEALFRQADHAEAGHV